MIIKIGGVVQENYNSNDLPIMLILSQEEKELLANMDPDADKFCSFPDEIPQGAIEKWMAES